MTADTPKTVQELAALVLRQPASCYLPAKERRFLFGLESWPVDLEVKAKDRLRVTKLFEQVRKMQEVR
jgi:hypothetical protein